VFLRNIFEFYAKTSVLTHIFPVVSKKFHIFSLSDVVQVKNKLVFLVSEIITIETMDTKEDTIRIYTGSDIMAEA